MHKCKICNNSLFSEPLLVLKNVPKSAQYFLEKSDLKKDKGIDLIIYQCKGCGVAQIKNKPVSYYRDVIRASGFSQEMIDFRIRQFKEFVDKYNLYKKTFIEIGCGKGEYLSIMDNFITFCYGLENNLESVEECTREGLFVHKGFVEEGFTLVHKYDSFGIFNFLEHVPNINEFLRGLLEGLSSNAVGIIEVPNFDMVLKCNLFSEFIVDHLYYFTKETIKTLLELNGFTILSIDTVCDDYIISIVVQKKKQLDLNYFYDSVNVLKEDFEKNIAGHKVAVWGAGHQALTLISLLNIQDSIDFIIDSAPFKQNKFAPVSHLPIISPENPLLDTVDTIILIAGSYNNDVKNLIKSNYTNKYRMLVIENNKLKEVF
jgi:2-polyprenyl-3-methyl-5-hydroxy-6-metoxy-1,4-benzoquinol methylase